MVPERTRLIVQSATGNGALGFSYVDWVIVYLYIIN